MSVLLLLSGISQSVGEENNSVIVKKKKKTEFMKTFLTNTRTIPARRTGDERLILYTFVIVKTKNRCQLSGLVLEGCLVACVAGAWK